MMGLALISLLSMNLSGAYQGDFDNFTLLSCSTWQVQGHREIMGPVVFIVVDGRGQIMAQVNQENFAGGLITSDLLSSPTKNPLYFYALYEGMTFGPLSIDTPCLSPLFSPPQPAVDFVAGGGLAYPALQDSLMVQQLLFDATRMAWSPDGRTLAVVPGSTPNKLYLLDQTGQQVRELSLVHDEILGLSWSPSSRWLAFIKMTAANDYFLSTMDVEDRDLQVSVGADYIAQIDWSSQHSTLGLLLRRQNQQDIYLLTEEALSQLTRSGHVQSFDWSPTGRAIVYSVGEHQTDLYIRDLSNGMTTSLTTDALTSDYWPQWSPDASRIAFARGRLTPDCNLRLFMIEAAGTGLTRISDQPLACGPTPERSFSWSRDGQQLVFAALTGERSQVTTWRLYQWQRVSHEVSEVEALHQ